MNVTHVPEFGKPAYVHVTVDTYSHMIFASARSGEAIKDVIQHLIQSFLTMGKPMKIKSDNAPAYASKAFASFLQAWKTTQVTGIPCALRGRLSLEGHVELEKNQMTRLRAANSYLSPHHLLSHSLCIKSLKH